MTDKIVLIVMLILLVTLVVLYILVCLAETRYNVYTDRAGNYYRWLRTELDNALLRPLKKVGFWYVSSLASDFWIDADTSEFRLIENLTDFFTEEELNLVKIKLEEYDSSHPKMDEILFVKELAGILSVKRSRVFELVQEVRRQSRRKQNNGLSK